MAPLLGDRTIVEATIGRALSNALGLSFRAGPGPPFAEAHQGRGDGTGSKLGVLLGFKNGGVGKHSLTSAGGDRRLTVETRTGASTLVTDEALGPLGSLERTDEASFLLGPEGRELARIIGHPDGAKQFEAFRLQIVDPSGPLLGDFDVIRTLAGWTLGRDIVDGMIWWDRAGQSLKAPCLGTSLRLLAPVDPEVGDLLMALSVDAAIGLRPYVRAMRD